MGVQNGNSKEDLLVKIIILHGAPAVGKLTVAQALAQKTGYVILHNHLTIDLALLIFPFGSTKFHQLLQRLRFLMLKEAAKEDCPGMIWTTGLPNVPEVRASYRRLDRFAKKHNGSTYYVHLVCDFEEQKKRVKGNSRKKFQKRQSITQLKKTMREVDYSSGHIGDSSMRIDNTQLSPQQVSELIIKHFHLRKADQ